MQYWEYLLVNMGNHTTCGQAVISISNLGSTSIPSGYFLAKLFWTFTQSLTLKLAPLKLFTPF